MGPGGGSRVPPAEPCLTTKTSGRARIHNTLATLCCVVAVTLPSALAQTAAGAEPGWPQEIDAGRVRRAWPFHHGRCDPAVRAPNSRRGARRTPELGAGRAPHRFLVQPQRLLADLGHAGERDAAQTTATQGIEGNCDERGSAEYNIGLGDRRASAAKDFLVQLGVPADKLKTVSYGKERPVCTEANEACWQRNRHDHFAAAQ
jgi:OmpA family